MRKKNYQNTTTKMFEEKKDEYTRVVHISHREKKKKKYEKSDVVLVISTGNLFGSCLIYRPCNFIYSRKLFRMRDKNDDAFAMFFARCCFIFLVLLKLSLLLQPHTQKKTQTKAKKSTVHCRTRVAYVWILCCK